MTEGCSCLDELKKQYSKLEKKYKLPSFQQLNEDFEIEKVQEKETDTLLREIRKIIMDKVLNYLRFTEMLLNPQGAPLFFFSLLKGIEATDRKILEDVYSKLGKLEIEVIAVDIIYSEQEEAKFIEHLFKEWQEIKKTMDRISKALMDGWKKKTQRKEKSYLG